MALLAPDPRRIADPPEAPPADDRVPDALAALEGKTLDSVAIQAVGPSAYVVSVRAEDLELSVRLDRQGARIASVGI